MALAKPVMGTRVPAPANFASFSYKPSPVNRALRKIRQMDAQALAASFSAPMRVNRFRNTSPRVQMPPPMRKALGMVIRLLVGGDACSAIF